MTDDDREVRPIEEAPQEVLDFIEEMFPPTLVMPRGVWTVIWTDGVREVKAEILAEGDVAEEGGDEPTT